MLPRQELAEKVITGLQDYAYVFGGYLRDKLAGEEFTDVDLFFPTGDPTYPSLSSFKIPGKLRSLGLAVHKVHGGKPVYAANGTSVRRSTYEVTDPLTGASIQVDAVTNSTADHPFSDLDADVNSLYFDRTSKQIKPHWITPYTMENIQTHIKEKIFEVPDAARIAGHRLNKLLYKGYVPLNLKYNREEILKNFNQKKDDIEVLPAFADFIQKKLDQKVMKNNSKPVPDGMYNVLPGTFKVGDPHIEPPEVRKEAKKMDFFEQALTQAKSEMAEAAWRGSADEMAKGFKEGLIAMMKDQGADDGTLAFITKFLETPAGTAAVKEVLGHSLPHAPFGIGEDLRVQKVSKEFRIQGYQGTMQLFLAMAMKYFLPAIQRAMEKLPAVTAADMAELDAVSKAKVRVESNTLSLDTLMQTQVEVQTQREIQAELEQLRAEVATLKRQHTT